MTLSKTDFLPEGYGEREPMESRIQADAFAWFHNTYPDLRSLLYHVPNGGRRNKIEATKLKAMGVVPGVPDIVFHFRGKTWFFEFKDDTGKPSDDQLKVHAALRAQGFIVWIVRTVEHFQDTIKGIIENDKTEPFKVGLTKNDYYYRHKVFEFLYGKINHNEIVKLDDICETETKLKFLDCVKDFIRFRFDEKDNFELLFTPDFEAICRRDKGKIWEPIFYKGRSVIDLEL